MLTALRDWALDTGIRALKTGGQTAVALLATNTAGMTAVDWGNVLDVAGLAAIVTVLHNLAGLRIPGDSLADVDPAP